MEGAGQGLGRAATYLNPAMWLPLALGHGTGHGQETNQLVDKVIGPLSLAVTGGALGAAGGLGPAMGGGFSPGTAAAQEGAGLGGLFTETIPGGGGGFVTAKNAPMFAQALGQLSSGEDKRLARWMEQQMQVRSATPALPTKVNRPAPFSVSGMFR